MDKFIHVFDENTKKELMSCGYKLIQTIDNQGNNIYVFQNKEEDNFCLKNFDKRNYLLTNTLMF